MSIQKRKTGYLVRWRRDGRQHGRMFTRRTDADAHELEMRRQAQAGAHGVAIPSRKTLDDWLDEWWVGESSMWAASTRTQRGNVLKKWVRPLIGGVRLKDLGSARVREYRVALQEAGCPPSQANQALAVLSAALGVATKDGLLPANPVLGVRRQPVAVKRPQALTPAELEDIMARMPRQRDRVLVALMGYGGLRPEEPVALTWGSVTDQLLIVDRAYTYGELKPTKTSTRRTVELCEPLADDLAAWRPAKPARGALVVPSHTGGFIDWHNWRQRVWKKAVDAAGITAAPYDCRHSFASLLIHEGRSLPYVTAALGHSTATTTLGHYAHLYDGQRLGTAVTMVDAIQAARARRGVHDLCTPAEPRRLRQSAPRR